MPIAIERKAVKKTMEVVTEEYKTETRMKFKKTARALSFPDGKIELYAPDDGCGASKSFKSVASAIEWADEHKIRIITWI